MTIKKIIKITVILAIPIVSAMLVFLASKNNQSAVSNALKGRTVTVYRSKSCGCCANYVSYLKRAGALVEVKLTEDMTAVRKQFGVSDRLSSCHTARIDDYTVEGHIPIEAIEKLLIEKPKLAGIALPEMPAGSPGMPGRKTEVFQITGFTAAGSSSPYLSL